MRTNPSISQNNDNNNNDDDKTTFYIIPAITILQCPVEEEDLEEDLRVVVAEEDSDGT